MPNTVSCERCGDDVAESETVYADDGSLVCGPCGDRDSLRQAEREAERSEAAKGGLMDRMFLKNLNETGRKAYWFGQIGIGLAVVIGFFATLGLEETVEDYELPLMGAILLSVFGWGGLCTLLWPYDDGVDRQDYDDFDV